MTIAPMIKTLRFFLCDAYRYQSRHKRAPRFAPRLPGFRLSLVTLALDSVLGTEASHGNGLRLGIGSRHTLPFRPCDFGGSDIGDTGDSTSAAESWRCFSVWVSIAPTIHIENQAVIDGGAGGTDE